jgi:hypothetical protein
LLHRGRRSRAIDTLRRHLLRRSVPRLQMSLIVGATGLAGFGVSVLLLGAGMTSMPLRYLSAVAAAYAVFLLLVRIWAEFHRRQLDGPDVLDVIDPFAAAGSGDHSAQPEVWQGGEGEFGGGGAGRSWGNAVTTDHAGTGGADVIPSSPAPADSAAGCPIDVDVDDGGLLLLPLIVLLGGVLAAGYVVYAAPALMAEVLLDVALVSGLYRSLRRIPPQSWLGGAFRRTWLPVTLVALLLVAGGAIMQHSVPGADSIGDVFAAARD